MGFVLILVVYENRKIYVRILLYFAFYFCVLIEIKVELIIYVFYR